MLENGSWGWWPTSRTKRSSLFSLYSVGAKRISVLPLKVIGKNRNYFCTDMENLLNEGLSVMIWGSICWHRHVNPGLIFYLDDSMELGHTDDLVCKLELLQLPWYDIRKGSGKFREMGKTEKTNHIRPEKLPPDYVPWEIPKDIHLLRHNECPGEGSTGSNENSVMGCSL